MKKQILSVGLSVLALGITVGTIGCGGSTQKPGNVEYVQAPTAFVKILDDQITTNRVVMGGKARIAVFSWGVSEILPTEMVWERTTRKRENGQPVLHDDSFKSFSLVRLKDNGKEESVKMTCSLYPGRDIVTFDLSSEDKEPQTGDLFAVEVEAKDLAQASSVITSLRLSSYSYKWAHGEVEVKNVNPETREISILESLLSAKNKPFTPSGIFETGTTLAQVTLSLEGRALDEFSVNINHRGSLIKADTKIKADCFLGTSKIAEVDLDSNMYVMLSNLPVHILGGTSVDLVFKLNNFQGVTLHGTEDYLFNVNQVSWQQKGDYADIYLWENVLGSPTWLTGLSN